MKDGDGRSPSSDFRFPDFAHAPSVPGEARGCDGYAGASRQPRGRFSSGPGRPGRACLEGPLVETHLGPLEGSPGLPCGTRVTAICVPVRCFGALVAHLEPLKAVSRSPPLLALLR